MPLLPKRPDENKFGEWLTQAAGWIDRGKSHQPAGLGSLLPDNTTLALELTMPRVLIGPYLLRKQPGRFRQILTDAGFEPVDPEGDFALTTEQLRPHLASIDALIAGGERMTPDLFDAAPKLRAIARTGVGYDLIDVAAATRHRVAVTITPGTNQESVAEQTMALLLALARRIVSNDRIIHARRLGPRPGHTGPRHDPGPGRHGPDRPGSRLAGPGVPDAGRRVRYGSDAEFDARARDRTG